MDWSPAEDLRPAIRFAKQQPEKTARGLVWTLVVTFRSAQLDWDDDIVADLPCYTQMTVRDCSGELITNHGRIFSPTQEDDAA